MINFKSLFCIVSVVSVLCVPAFAKKQPMKTYYISGGEEIQKSTSSVNSQSKSELSGDKLSEEQKQKVNLFISQEKSKVSALEKNLSRAKKELYTELLKEMMNLTTINNLKNEIISTASEIEKIRFDTECKIRNILTPSQYYNIHKKHNKIRK